MSGILNDWINFTNNKIWLVTNRHNIYPAPLGYTLCPPSKGYKEHIPCFFDIYLQNCNSQDWKKITLDRKNLLEKGKVHKDADVDIAAIEITDLLKDRLKKSNDYIDYFVFHKDQFPTSLEAENTEVIVIGFPESRPHATKPEIRVGSIKSTWGSKLDGCAIFEVNLVAEHGFSGSPVISRPRDSESTYKTSKGRKDNQPSFLGVSTGLRKQNDTITTTVFYGNLVEECVKDGHCFFAEKYREAEK